VLSFLSFSIRSEAFFLQRFIQFDLKLLFRLLSSINRLSCNCYPLFICYNNHLCKRTFSEELRRHMVEEGIQKEKEEDLLSKDV
jgi:hypothetical protein